ncbi:MAG: hypothetical protein HYX31_21015 [Mycobacterium sp.]|uniref:hypothetical protein n=1 Tax=Mycobacterium gordonae TaxID=1778 RepID=UPI0012EA716C|nr:hypothetical protein [Mycobacterium gordonae]MBI2701575.1 hypothetical protein [Mycobacterium sp.]
MTLTKGMRQADVDEGAKRMHPEIGGDLLKRDPVITIASDPNNVVTELPGLRPRHDDIFPAHPSGASQLR